MALSLAMRQVHPPYEQLPALVLQALAIQECH